MFGVRLHQSVRHTPGGYRSGHPACSACGRMGRCATGSPDLARHDRRGNPDGSRTTTWHGHRLGPRTVDEPAVGSTGSTRFKGWPYGDGPRSRAWRRRSNEHESRPVPDEGVGDHEDRRPLRRHHPRPRQPADRHGPLRSAGRSLPSCCWTVASDMPAVRVSHPGRSRCSSPTTQRRPSGSAFPVLGNPFNRNKTTGLTANSFTMCTATRCRARSRGGVYERCHVPARTTPTSTSTSPVRAEGPTKVDFTRDGLAPMLSIAFDQDHIVLPGGPPQRRKHWQPNVITASRSPGSPHFPERRG